MRELVIVIQDLYLPGEPAAGEPLALPGLGFVTRFGARLSLAHGWRAWLAGWVGRAQLARVAPARIAAAVHPLVAAAPDTLWIAVPVHLTAGLSRVHLDRRGLVYLHPDELAQLAQDFARTFAGSGFSLTPASPRELLLLTPGVEAVATPEPARFADAEVNEALPRGPAAAGLRRTWTEMEMWLHSQASNQARAVPMTALWPWGAQGTVALPAPAAAQSGPAAFAQDAFVRGLWHICGLAYQSVPESFTALEGDGGRVVLVLEAGSLMHGASQGLAAALAQLDARYLAPAVAALRAGRLDLLRLIANDRCLSVRRRSAFKLWRPAPAGLAGLE